MSLAEEFARIYESEVDSVYGFLAHRTNSREIAEDLTQTTFERVLAHWDRFDPSISSERTWIMTIANNLLRDHLRRAERRLQRPFGESERGGDVFVHPGSVELEPDLGVDLAIALDELDDRSRTLLAMKYGGDMTGPEIAAATDLTLSNVQQILSRAIRRLREALVAANDSHGLGGEGSQPDQADRGYSEQDRSGE